MVSSATNTNATSASMCSAPTLRVSLFPVLHMAGPATIKICPMPEALRGLNILSVTFKTGPNEFLQCDRSVDPVSSDLHHQVPPAALAAAVRAAQIAVRADKQQRSGPTPPSNAGRLLMQQKRELKEKAAQKQALALLVRWMEEQLLQPAASRLPVQELEAEVKAEVAASQRMSARGFGRTVASLG